MKTRKGQTVTIYREPMTATDPEGDAVLVGLLYRGLPDGMEMWSVRFQSDPDTVCVRRVWTRRARQGAEQRARDLEDAEPQSAEERRYQEGHEI